MLYVGVDTHQQMSQTTVLDTAGRILKREGKTWSKGCPNCNGAQAGSAGLDGLDGEPPL